MWHTSVCISKTVLIVLYYNCYAYSAWAEFTRNMYHQTMRFSLQDYIQFLANSNDPMAWLIYNLDVIWRLLDGRETVHLIRPLGLDWGAYTSAFLPVFWTPLCQLRSRFVSDEKTQGV